MTLEATTEHSGGLLHEWGPQAWIDMFMSRRMIVDKATCIVVYTFLPVLRLLSDAEKVDLEWEEIGAMAAYVWSLNNGTFLPQR